MSSNTDTDFDIDVGAVDRPSILDEAATELTLEHVVIENEDAPNECAIFPGDATEEELMTTWITAHDDAFVDREAMR